MHISWKETLSALAADQKFDFRRLESKVNPPDKMFIGMLLSHTRQHSLDHSDFKEIDCDKSQLT